MSAPQRPTTFPQKSLWPNTAHTKPPLKTPMPYLSHQKPPIPAAATHITPYPTQKVHGTFAQGCENGCGTVGATTPATAVGGSRQRE